RRQFDVVVVSFGIHHLVIDLDTAMANIAGAIKSGGALIISEPNANYLLGTNSAHLVQAGPSPLRGEIRACPVARPSRPTLRVSLLRRARRIPRRTVDTPVPPLDDHSIATVCQVAFGPLLQWPRNALGGWGCARRPP